MYIGEQVPTNFVPAVAVIRGGRALFIGIWRKGSVGCLLSFLEKSETGSWNLGINTGRTKSYINVNGIYGGGVTSEDIVKTINRRRRFTVCN